MSLILWDLPFVLFNQVSTILSTTQGWFEHIFYFMYFISKCVLLFTKISESHKNRTDTLYLYDDGEVVMVHLTILGVPGEGSIYLYFGRVCSVPFYMKNV